MPKIGLISPIAKEYPFLGRDLKEGLSIALKNNAQTSIIYLECGRGIPKEVVPAFRKAIIDEEVDLIVAFVDNSSLQEVMELIEQSQTPVIATGMGARLPLISNEPESYLFYNTFRLWESCWLSGHIASKMIGTKIGSISSFFNSGFPLVYAHTKGAESAGGTPVFFNITHKGTLDEELAATRKNIEEVKADYYFLSYYGKERTTMLDWTTKAGIDKKRIVATPGILTKNESVFTVSSWHKDLDTTENKVFIDIFKQHSKHDVNEFSMLGYENGLLIKHCCNEKKFNADEFTSKLKDVGFAGPRGEIHVQKENQATYSNHYIRNINNDDGSATFSVIEYPLAAIENETRTNQEANRIGWQNTYLCK